MSPWVVKPYLSRLPRSTYLPVTQVCHSMKPIRALTTRTDQESTPLGHAPSLGAQLPIR